ncbi:MAG: hypothetical protein OHK0015_17780 [Chloroflexi bacterium OHK40]
MRLSIRRRALALVLALAALPPTLALAGARTLNGPLALGMQIEPVERLDVRFGRSLLPGYQFTPGGDVLFLADQTTSGVIELYRAHANGSTPTRLSALLAPGGNVIEFATTATHAVYLADQRVDETYELFSVPLTGGEPALLNSLLVPGGDVTSFVLSPDGSTVIFRADRDEDEIFDLFSAPLTGGGPEQRLNPRQGPTGDVQPDLAISADNQRVLFRYNPADPASFDLFSAPLTGGAPALDVTPTPIGDPGGPSVLDFALSPDGSRVALRTRDPATGSVNLHIAAVSGAPTLFALTAFDAGSAVEAPGTADVPPEDQPPTPQLPYAFAPAGDQIVFIADATDGVYQLHSVEAPAGPGAAPPPLLISPIITGTQDVTNFAISPDGRRVVYRADVVEGAFELLAVDIAGTGTTFLMPAPPATADVDRFAITADSQRVIFRGDIEADGRYELFSSALGRSADRTRISGELPSGGDVAVFALAADGQRVVYLADQAIDGVTELFVVLATGGAPLRLSPPLVSGGTIGDFIVGPEPGRARVLFRADANADRVAELRAVPATGGAATLITAGGAVGGDVHRFALAPDGGHVVYLADQDVDGVVELYSRALGGEGALSKLNAPLEPDGQVLDVAVSPDGRRAVYLATQGGEPVLGSVPISGGEGSILTRPLPEGGAILRFRISPDSRRVVYLADHERAGVFELYSVPITGGPAERLSALIDGRVISAYAISPDSRRVVYLADQEAAGRQELFSVPIGGGAVRALNGPLPEGGTIGAFAISPVGGLVVYAGEQRQAGTVELYRVPIGGGVPVPLGMPPESGSGVDLTLACAGQARPGAELAPLLVSPDGRHVLFCASQISGGPRALYSVPLAGGSTVRLNLPTGAGGGVTRYTLSDDGAWAVFVVTSPADAGTREQLYSAPIEGASPPTALYAPEQGPARVAAFAISPDSATVAMIGADEANRPALFAAPIDGGAPRRLSGVLATGEGVVAFAIADAIRAIYLLDGPEGATLYVRRLDGNGVPVRINGALVAGGDVWPDFALLPGGAGVVYRADATTDEVEELYLVPLLPHRLHVPLLGWESATDNDTAWHTCTTPPADPCKGRASAL